MKTKIDEIYKDIKGRIKYKTVLFTKNPKENIKILSKVVETVNIAKCNLADLDMELSGSSLYLMWLLQTKENIPFELCKELKMWFNQEGLQLRCNKKENAYKCQGKISNCPL